MALRKIAVILGLIIALDAAAMAQQPFVLAGGSSEPQVGDIVVTLDRCVLQDGQTVTNLPKGVQLRVVALNGDWFGCSVYVNDKAERGWIKKWLVAKATQGETNQPPASAITGNPGATNADSKKAFRANDIKLGDVVVALENTTLRLGQQLVAEVPKGAQLRVTGINGDWVNVAVVLGGREQAGWVERRTIAVPQKPASATGADKSTVKETGESRFIAYDNGTVLDKKTNLMWAAKDNGRALSWPDAKSYCENYHGGGYADWRMPTLDELTGLYDKAKTYKSDCPDALDEHGMVADDVHLTELIHLACTRIWTSQARTGFPGSVLMFDFHYGHDSLRPGFQGFIDTAGRTLPVRSAK